MFMFPFVAFFILFFVSLFVWSSDQVEPCSTNNIYKNEIDQIAEKFNRSTRIKAFGTTLTFPSRYIYVLEEGSNGESVMSGNVLVSEPIQYQGCMISKSIYGNAWFGSIDKCDNCESKTLLNQGAKQLQNIEESGLNIDVYSLGEELEMYAAYFYDDSSFLAVMDGNYYLIKALSDAVLKGK